MPIRLDRATETLEVFAQRLQPQHALDAYEELLEDLFLIRNPKFKFIADHSADVAAFIATYRSEKTLQDCGEWFFFPWNATLAHFLPEEEHLEIRTARNRNIVTAEEQQRLYGLRVAYAGLSVGSHCVTTFALMGGARAIKIADPDTVSPSNLNRIRFDYLSIGRKKTDLVREYVYQLNPYALITTFDEGVNDQTIAEFLSDVDVLVEETDNLGMKIRLRLEARKRGIPVIMATDNGDNIIFETERFDIDRAAQLFNGAIGDISLEKFQSFPPHELPRLATRIAGADRITERMMESLPAVGTSIYSWPQMADAATLSGVAVAYALKRLALGQSLTAGKREVNLDAIFDDEYSARQPIRDENRKQFLASLGL